MFDSCHGNPNWTSCESDSPNASSWLSADMCLLTHALYTITETSAAMRHHPSTPFLPAPPAPWPLHTPSPPSSPLAPTHPCMRYRICVHARAHTLTHMQTQTHTNVDTCAIQPPASSTYPRPLLPPTCATTFLANSSVGVDLVVCDSTARALRSSSYGLYSCRWEVSRRWRLLSPG